MTRSRRTWHWLRLVFGGGLIFGASGTDCVTDFLRETSDELNQLANDLDGDEEEDGLFADWFD